MSRFVSALITQLRGESLRNLPPDRKACRKMLLRLIRKLGKDATCALFSVEGFILARWLMPDSLWKPRDRKLVFLIHALIFEPEKLRSPFDIITCGRFVADD